VEHGELVVVVGHLSPSGSCRPQSPTSGLHAEPAVKGVVAGDPREEATEIGPLVPAAQLEVVSSFVPEGAPVAFQRSSPDGLGHWSPPRVLAAVGRTDEAVTEEVLGSMVVVVAPEDEAAAIRSANGTPSGLSGSIWTRDLGRGLRTARGIESANLSVSSHSSVRVWTPFGGFTQPGIGRELGPDALDAFSEARRSPSRPTPEPQAASPATLRRGNHGITAEVVSWYLA
jgi:acyl-CoA reductase-like NAD-dependent aldehyde dehydrogenase